MGDKNVLTFDVPAARVRIGSKLEEYQKRFRILDRDMVYILMQELFRYYTRSLIYPWKRPE